MNLGLSFQRNKVSRLISVNGSDFVFKRQKKNDFGEPIKDSFDTITARGFYHETSSYVTKSTSEGSVVRSKPTPLILMMPDEASKLLKNDILEYKGKQYNVVDFTDVNELGICVDVSLEVVQNA